MDKVIILKGDRIMAATTTCINCSGRGSVWEEIAPGMWKNSLCDCRTPEEWATIADQEMSILCQMYNVNGGDNGGEMANAGR